MNEIDILNLDDCKLSERNGLYGGKAGSKEGIIINDEYWMIKYPKSTKGMRGNLDSYTTSPLSEYIGSHIYEILGYDVHETLLGIRNEKLVVACKDFCKNEGALREARTLKNTFNKDLEKILETEISSTSSSHIINLNEELIHFEYNPIFTQVPELINHFWNLVIIDGLINNNDRNNGNWGLLFEDGIYSIAPIFDNGASFSNKMTEQDILKKLSNEKGMEESSLNIMTIFGIDGKQLSYKNLINSKIDDENFANALYKNVILIKENFENITNFINSIPETYNGISVCSKARKEFYIMGMKLRLEKILEPAYEKVKSKIYKKEKLSDIIEKSQKKRQNIEKNIKQNEDVHKNEHQR